MLANGGFVAEPTGLVTNETEGTVSFSAVTLTSSISFPPLYESQVGLRPSKALSSGVADDAQPVNKVATAIATKADLILDKVTTFFSISKFTLVSPVRS